MYGKVSLETTEGPKEFEFVANAATKIRYRQVFGEDLEAELAKLKPGDRFPSEFPEKLGFIMNQQAAGADMKKQNEDTYIKWAEQFEPEAVYRSGNSLIEIYFSNRKTTSTAKNPQGPQSEK